VDENDDSSTGAAAGPAVGGPAPKTFTIAAAEKQINDHFKAKGVTPVEDGVKVGDSGTLGISYSDMMLDLTRNYTHTQPNLTYKDRQRVLKLLKKMRMPISYIRNKKLKEEYKILLSGQPTPTQQPRVK
jgi:hypothetical protein